MRITRRLKRCLKLLGHIKVALMHKKKDVNGLLKFLSESVNKSDANMGRAAMALVKLGDLSVGPICEYLKKTEDDFLKFTLIRILYSIANIKCAPCLVDEVKKYLEKHIGDRYSPRKPEPHGKKAVYYIAVKTLKHLNYPPKEWGIANKPYYEKVRQDYEKSES